LLDFPRWKVWAVSLTVAIGVLLSIPSLIVGSRLASYWPSWLPTYHINLGLDLAGGSQLLLEADVKDSAKQRLQAMEDQISTELRRDPRVAISEISTAGGSLSFLVRNPAQVDTAVERLRALTKPVGTFSAERDWTVQVMDSTRIVMAPTEAGNKQALKDAMTVARDVVRRRIDPQGTKEITVINQGETRILVQVPGVEDPEALKQLIGQTARLEFKLVALDADPNQVQEGRAPPGAQVLPMADGTGFIAVKRRVMVSGDQLVDASQGFDEQNAPVINITFNSAGARRRY
jgi:preprotein translocase subunit SecD